MTQDAFEKPWHGLESERTPALALANTLDWRLRKEPIELLKSYSDLVRWARSVGAVEPAEARALRQWGEDWGSGPADIVLADRRTGLPVRKICVEAQDGTQLKHENLIWVSRREAEAARKGKAA